MPINDIYASIYGEKRDQGGEGEEGRKGKESRSEERKGKKERGQDMIAD